MRTILIGLFLISIAIFVKAQPVVFGCTSNDGFGYYISSASSSSSGSTLTYSSSRLSKITTSTGLRTTLCTEAQIGVSLNAMGFNPQDKFLYAVSRYDVNAFSGVLYKIGENCQKTIIPVTGAIVKFNTNNTNTVDAAGGNISSGTFDLDNNYYVNTSFTNAASTGFTNKIQTIKISGNTATVTNTRTLTCPSCSTSTKLQITDIIFDAATNKLYGSNKITNTLYSINAATGVITPVGLTGITAGILGIYKNVYGDIRGIDDQGRIYAINVTTGAFTYLNSQAVLNSGNADAASGCYDPPAISGNLFIDANGLTDNLVNGTGAGVLAGIPIYAQLIQGGLIVKSTQIELNGFYQFLGLFTGTYEVRISSNAGTVGAAPPAQTLPSNYAFVGDHIGLTAGSDGSPNGRLTVTIPVGGADVINVNFGVDARPVAANVVDASQANPGTTVHVVVPALAISDMEDGTPTTVIINQIPNVVTEGILYYNGIAVTNNQVISNFNASLLTLDPIDGDVTALFNYSTVDAAGLVSNLATVTMEFFNTFPIELLFFRGAYVEKTVQLYWKSATETNSDYYSVERSRDGAEFKAFTKVDAAGNSTTELDYEAEDQSPNEYFYYRLKIVDQDESFEYSPVIYIQHQKELLLDVYPTATSDKIFIRFNGDEVPDLQVKLFDASGRLLKSMILNETEKEIDVNELPNGFYNLVIKDSKDGTTVTKKIVKR